MAYKDKSRISAIITITIFIKADLLTNFLDLSYL